MQEGRSRPEEEYFLKREKELIDKLRERSRLEAERRGLAEAVGVDNHEILEVLKEMGFDRDSVVLLGVLPLLQIAWSDGGISPQEREGILEIARMKGVADGSPAHAKLLGWLAESPEPDLFQRALVIIRDLMAYQHAEQREKSAQSLVEACERIASASGGILGLGSRVSAPEREVIRRVAAEIEKAHEQAARRMTGSL